MSSNQDLTKISLLPHDLKDLYDSDEKIGKIKFTKEEKLALAKLVDMPVWNILKNVYVKQRLVQTAIAGVNIAQSVEMLMYEKGKAAEANQFVKEVEKVVKEFNEEEAKKSAKS